MEHEIENAIVKYRAEASGNAWVVLNTGPGTAFVVGTHRDRASALAHAVQLQATYALTAAGTAAGVAYAVVEWVMLFTDPLWSQAVDPLQSVVTASQRILEAGREEICEAMQS